MPRFTFQLEAVLRVRKNAEHQKQRELGVVQAKMTALESQLHALDADVKQSNEGMRQNHLLGLLDLNLLAAHRRYLNSTQRRAMELAQQMSQVQQSLDLARAAVAAAARDRKVLEKLREKQLAAWQFDLQRRDAAALDEVFTQMSVRKNLP
jgi:flagellar FliJ protein